MVNKCLLLADLGCSDQHSRLPKRKCHERSRQAASDPKQTSTYCKNPEPCLGDQRSSLTRNCGPKYSLNPTVFKFNVGYQIMPTLAIEAGYGRTGKLSYSVNSASSSEKLDVYTLGLAASFPVVDKLSLTTRGGAANVRTSVKAAWRTLAAKRRDSWAVSA